MDKNEFETLDDSSRSGSIVHYIIIALLVITIVILLGVFFFSPESIIGIRGKTGLDTPAQQTSELKDAGTSPDDASSSTKEADLARDQATGTPSGIAGADDDSGDALQSAEADRTDERGPDGAPASDPAEILCDKLANNVENFFTTLDSRDYIQAFQLETPSSTYFPELIQKLIDNPPIVSGETDDLFTILQNTAHFFRIIGKKNILVLKGILDRERDTFEQILADFYQLTSEPDCLKQRFDLVIDDEPLYAYAGFFLNTMGGRLYLFRRDSMSRMVVSYYAILIIEQSNREGRNTYGIEIKDAIDNLIIEIESSRIKLKMRDLYLDTLYDLKVKYQ